MTQVSASAENPDCERLHLASDPVDERIVLWFFMASLVYLSVAMLAGFLYSLQFLQFHPFAGMEFFSPGRWRMVHTHVVTHGFIAGAFLGSLHWAVPRLTLRPVLSRKLSWFIFFLWQVVVLSAAVGILLGHAQAVEWGETPTFIDPPVIVGLILVASNFMTPILKTKGPIHVSLWFFMAALIWTVLVYAMSNFLPEYFVGGSASAALAGLYPQDMIGLFVAPIGWGLMYYFVPIILEKPIWSHGLSLAGFWGLVFFYPLHSVYHFIDDPMLLRYGAVVSTIVVGFVTTTVIVNFFATLHRRGEMLRSSMPIRWFCVGMVFYATACLQRAFQVTRTFEEVVHFTDWTVGHAHLVMFGVFGFWIMGIMTHLIPRLLGAARWYNPRWNEWHFWLTGVGMLVMFVDLMTAGLIQGLHWRNLAPWEDSITSSVPFWQIRTVSGVMMIAGQLIFVCHVLMTAVLGGAPVDDPTTDPGGASEIATV